MTLDDVKSLPIVLTPSEAAEVLKVSPQTVRNAMKDGTIPVKFYMTCPRVPTALLLETLGVKYQEEEVKDDVKDYQGWLPCMRAGK